MLNGIVVVVSLVCLFFPTVASATEVLEPNFEVLEPNIQILEPDTEGIASFRQKKLLYVIQEVSRITTVLILVGEL